VLWKVEYLSSIQSLKFLNLALFCLPFCQPAIRPSSTGGMAIDYLRNKDNHYLCIYKTVILINACPLHHGLFFTHLFPSFSLVVSYRKVRNSQKGIDRLSQLLVTSHAHERKTAACTCEHNNYPQWPVLIFLDYFLLFKSFLKIFRYFLAS